MSLRRLAQLTGVDVAHLSRVLRGKNGKRPTGELARRVADALELPAFYFPESRELAVREELARDPGLRERVFAEIDPRD